jgi:hypothetical protein
VVADNYPVSAKLYLQNYDHIKVNLTGQITSYSRKLKCEFQEEQLIRLKDLFSLQKDICGYLGVTEIPF